MSRIRESGNLTDEDNKLLGEALAAYTASFLGDR